MVVVVGGMQANTETSRSSARAGASTTMSTLLNRAVRYKMRQSGSNNIDR